MGGGILLKPYPKTNHPKHTPSTMQMNYNHIHVFHQGDWPLTIIESFVSVLGIDAADAMVEA